MTTAVETMPKELAMIERMEKMIARPVFPSLYRWPKLNVLREEAIQALHLQARIVSTVGQVINVNEKFTVQFSVWLGSTPMAQNENWGLPVYNNVMLTVRPTQYARPVDPAVRPILMTPKLMPSLNPNLVHKEVEFIAVKSFEPQAQSQEPYVDAKLEADFDAEAFFHCVHTQTFSTDIQPT